MRPRSTGGAVATLWTGGFVLPAVLAVAAFIYVPLVASVVLSFIEWRPATGELRFAGLANYARVFASDSFAIAAGNTALYLVILVPAQIVVPFLLALALREVAGSRLAGLYYGALFAPTVISFSVAGAVWLPLLNPINGVFNDVLRGVGLSPLRWHNDPALALPCVALVTFWKSFGLNLVVWYAALVAVPKVQLEAAAIDGARFWRRVRDVELPLVSPTGFFILVTTLVNTLDEIVGVIDVLTSGGPVDRSTNLPYLMWQRGIVFFQFGQASVIAVVTIVLVLVVIWFKFRVVEPRVVYG
jgi:ABC-type sugar transport system permease subunit